RLQQRARSDREWWAATAGVPGRRRTLRIGGRATASQSRRTECAARRFQRSVEVVAQYLRPGRVTQLAHRLGLDLADPLPGDAVDLADLVQRLGLSVGEAE